MLQNRLIYIILLVLAQEAYVFSQEPADTEQIVHLSARLDLSYMFGGQFYNDHFVYDPGMGVQFTLNYPVSNSLEVGMGTGYISLMNENFIPIYMEAFGYKNNKRNSPVIRFQLGGVAAWFNTANYPSDYSINGGVFFSAGMGRKVPMKNNYYILFHWSICHISAKVNYQVFGNDNYSSPANYDMFQLSVGIIRE